MREPAPKCRQPVDPHWRRVSDALHNRIKYRERELAELSQEHLQLQAELKRAQRASLYWWARFAVQAVIAEREREKV